MLVLSRRAQEVIRIGTDITITVVSIGPKKVRLGITAPDDVRIDREEVRAAMQAMQAKGEKKNKPEAA